MTNCKKMAKEELIEKVGNLLNLSDSFLSLGRHQGAEEVLAERRDLLEGNEDLFTEEEAQGLEQKIEEGKRFSSKNMPRTIGQI